MSCCFFCRDFSQLQLLAQLPLEELLPPLELLDLAERFYRRDDWERLPLLPELLCEEDEEEEELLELLLLPDDDDDSAFLPRSFDSMAALGERDRERDRLLAPSCGPPDECPLLYYARIWSRRALIFASISILSLTGTDSPGSAGSLTVGLN